MRKIGIIAVLSLMALALAAVPAIAANPHFVGDVTGTDQGTRLLVTAKIAGLGEGTYFAEVQATGFADVTCRNPAGNVAPGQRTRVSPEGISGPLQASRTGNLRISVRTDTPTVTGAQACPNRKWTATVTDVDFTSATLLIHRGSPNGPVVLSSPVTIE
jgi:hypothetical protein